jgi:hypothetical protein
MARTAIAAATIPPIAPPDKEKAPLWPESVLLELLEEPVPLAELSRMLAGKVVHGLRLNVAAPNNDITTLSGNAIDGHEG